jgi:hypothetical protein
VALDGIGQRFQQGCGLPNPTCECGAIHIQALARKDLRLAVDDMGGKLAVNTIETRLWGISELHRSHFLPSGFAGITVMADALPVPFDGIEVVCGAPAHR